MKTQKLYKQSDNFQRTYLLIFGKGEDYVKETMPFFRFLVNY